MSTSPPIAPSIRQAGTDDLSAIAGLLDEASDWIRRHSVTNQWPARFETTDLEPRIERGELHIGFHNGTPIGAFALDDWGDPEFWHDDEREDACFLHRLVVKRAYAGQGLGGQLIEYAASLVARAGRHWLRLDCAKHNTRLHAYYQSLDFAYVRTVDLPHRMSGALFERPVQPGHEWR